MRADEWYDNYFCIKCQKQVHENHNRPNHECINTSNTEGVKK